MRDVAVVSFAQAPNIRRENRRNEVEMLIPVVTEAIEKSGVPKSEIGFTCSGSSDYLAGQSFSFVMAVDSLGAWPPIAESHVEMDGAWALYEAWIKIQCGEADSALVFCFGRSSPGRLRETLTLQHDPYTLAPLGRRCTLTSSCPPLLFSKATTLRKRTVRSTWSSPCPSLTRWVRRVATRMSSATWPDASTCCARESRRASST
jgi:hypothetical protein